MANTIVEIVFPWDLRYYAIYRGFDGRLLTWIDLGHIISDTEAEKMPEKIRDELGGNDCVAWFQTREESEKVRDAINRSR